MTNKATRPLIGHNRVAAIMAHTSRYGFRGISRLAKDSGLSKSTLSHIIYGCSNPLLNTILPIVRSLEYQLGRKLKIEEIFSHDGRYPTKSICKLVGCSGCLPERAYESSGDIKDEWADVPPGFWIGDCAEFGGQAQ